MIKHNIRIFAFVILGLAFVVYAIIFSLTQNFESIDGGKALTDLSTTISINITIWTVFVGWAWKWKIFYPWLVPFPNLSGEWEGYVKSNWKNKERESIPTNVSISQNFFNIQVKIATKESRSHSIGASFNIDIERGFQQLLYTYLNTPKSGVRDRSAIHYGTTILHLTGFNVTQMDGEYWTDRETTGEIILMKKKVA